MPDGSTSCVGVSEYLKNVACTGKLPDVSASSMLLNYVVCRVLDYSSYPFRFGH
jgi:hypothetical protein